MATTSKKKSQRAKRGIRRAVEEQHQPPDAPAHPAGFAVEDVVGESEFSTREAGEREAFQVWRAPGGYPDRDSLSADPEELGRRFLEEATQSPAHESLEPQPPQRDLEEASAAAEMGLAEND
jgi:hypothetical protein